MQLPVIVSLHIGQLLILLILQSQLLISVLFYVICQGILELCLLLESLSERLVDMHVGDIAVLEDNPEEDELSIEVLDHLAGHVSLEVEHLREPDAVDEVADALIDLCVEELVEAGRTQTIHEVLNLLLLSRHAEREVEVDTDVGVVLGGAVVDGGVVVHDGLGEHTGHSSVAAVAPVRALLHDACASPAALFERGQTRRNVELEVTAATTVGTLDHDNNRLFIGSGFGQHLNRFILGFALP